MAWPRPGEGLPGCRSSPALLLDPATVHVCPQGQFLPLPGLSLPFAQQDGPWDLIC